MLWQTRNRGLFHYHFTGGINVGRVLLKWGETVLCKQEGQNTNTVQQNCATAKPSPCFLPLVQHRKYVITSLDAMNIHNEYPLIMSSSPCIFLVVVIWTQCSIALLVKKLQRITTNLKTMKIFFLISFFIGRKFTSFNIVSLDRKLPFWVSIKWSSACASLWWGFHKSEHFIQIIIYTNLKHRKSMQKVSKNGMV